MLARFNEEVRPYWHKVGVIEGYVGDNVLVRFDEVVVQVPPEWIEAVGIKKPHHEGRATASTEDGGGGAGCQRTLPHQNRYATMETTPP